MSNAQPSKISGPVRRAMSGETVGETVRETPSGVLPLYVRAEPGRTADARAAVTNTGVSVRSETAGYIAADVRGGDVQSIAQSDAVRHIQLRRAPKAHAVADQYISEGVGVSNADALHADGITGSGARIAVIDHWFHTDNPKYSDRIAATVGDSSFFTTSAEYDPVTHGTQHGTACAEIVADMAPDAELILATTRGPQSFSQIMSTVESHDPDAATMSLGYQTDLRIDGLDPISQRVTQFINGGNRLFAVSAGNEADVGHWDGQFQDDGNGLMVFDQGLSEPTRYPVFMDPQQLAAEVHIHWDADWSQDNQDYEARLYATETATTALDTQQTTDPVEVLTLTPAQNNTDGGFYYVEIENISATGTEHFDMFRWGRAEFLSDYTTPQRSLGIPATGTNTYNLSVAAVQATSIGTTNEEHLKPYSSRGPTQDGRRGLDIAAPSMVSTTAEGDYGGYGALEVGGGFNGTSAAAPHVGGALGLLLGDRVDASQSQARSGLNRTGLGIADSSVSSPGSNNTKIGFGYVDVEGGAADVFVPEAPLNAAWTSNDLGGRAQYNRPAVDPQRVYAGGLQNTFYALTRSDGTVVDWSFDRGSAAGLSDSSGVLRDGTVFVGSGQGTFYALNASDGTENWSVNVGSAITSTPAVANGTVFAGTNDGTVYAWNADTGAQSWSTSVADAVYSELVVADGRVYVTTKDGDLVVLASSDGNEHWQASFQPFGSSSPSLGGGSVYVAADEVHAYTESISKTSEWTTSGFGGTSGTKPVHSGGTVYAGSDDGTVYAFSATDGSTSWTFSTGGPTAVALGVSPARTHVVAASMDGNLYLLDSSGDQLTSVSIPSDTRARPVLHEGLLLTTTPNGTAHAYEWD